MEKLSSDGAIFPLPPPPTPVHARSHRDVGRKVGRLRRIREKAPLTGALHLLRNSARDEEDSASSKCPRVKVNQRGRSRRSIDLPLVDRGPID